MVYNQTLLCNFINQYTILNKRFTDDPSIFSKKKWTTSPTKIDNQWVYDNYTNLVSKYNWNEDNTGIHIIPVCHGTDLAIGEKICETGFAALSSVDAGWFGKGIYFSSYPEYCIPYFVSRIQPCIIVSWIIPGNVYPVCEKHDGVNTLLGSAIKPGYNSHYIVTNHQGLCINGDSNKDGDSKKLYNEIVVAQEAQIVPAYLIHINPNTVMELNSKWLKQ